MIDATIRLTVPLEKRKELLQTLMAMLDPIRCERGCISCHCYADIEAEDNILFMTEWKTRKDLNLHLRSDHFGVLSGAMKLLKEEPEFRFNTIAVTAGSEVVKTAQA